MIECKHKIIIHDCNTTDGNIYICLSCGQTVRLFAWKKYMNFIPIDKYDAHNEHP